MPRLDELAGIVRSKNAGPFVLTLDLLFDSQEEYALVKDSGAITASRVASLYGVDESDVLLQHFDSACGIKISMPRLVSSGHARDTDVYGAQQHAPLLGIEIAVPSGGHS
ncbi:MAG: DUF4387 domain-containing protein [Trueperaceae bacterium]